MNTKNLVLSGLFITLGIIFPIFFHMLGMIGGQVFLPMHIPVLLAGFILGPISGVIVGVITPVLSSIITSMPPFMPMLPIMIVELTFYGIISGYMYQTKKINIFISLITSMIIGRIMSSMVVYIMVKLFAVPLPPNPLIFIQVGIITGLPGLLIQIVMIPMVVFLVEKGFGLHSNRGKMI